MDTLQVWVSDPVEGYVQATITKKLWEKITVETVHGKVLTVKPTEVFPYREDLMQGGGQDDMIDLPELNEPSLLWALQERYERNEIYTYIGPMIISVNPFKQLDIYDQKDVQEYLGPGHEESPPHVFAVANKCWDQVVQTRKSQSVVISGESGSGKTEATKYVLRFLTSVIPSARDNKGDLGTRILATNPVLEAFGNAKTVRNNNSSRFGKFIKIAVHSGTIVGGKIDSYLLEKTRIIHQDAGERNFHIFYQMLLGTTPSEKAKYGIRGGPEFYNYITNKQYQIEGVKDAHDFIQTKEALQTLGISELERDEYFTILSGILLLGNVEFVGQDPLENAQLADKSIIAQISKLLRVDPDTLVKTLTIKSMNMGGRDDVSKPLSTQSAIENRDGMAKALYSKVFQHLVCKLNEHLVINGQNPNFDLFIGVLDIYGFENFKNNSLEQFCINYANEKLHNQFVSHVLDAEQAEYKEEGVTWDSITFTDNKDTVQMIEAKGHMLSMLDDESKRPGASDQTFTSGVTAKYSRHRSFSPVISSQTAFTLRHYAEDVTYNTNGFLIKNKDTITGDVIKLLAGSKSGLIGGLFSEDLALLLEQESQVPQSPRGDSSGRFASQRPLSINLKSSASVRGGIAPRTSSADGLERSLTQPNRANDSVTKKFSYSLAQLIQTLDTSDLHYIRCIKPNMEAKPDLFLGQKVLSQLRSNGVLETVKLRKAGYAVRLTKDYFYNRYAVVDNLRPDIDLDDYLTNILDEEHFCVGNTKVFLKSVASDVLEGLRTEIYEQDVMVYQSLIRRFHAIQQLSDLKRIVKIQSFIRYYNAYRKAIFYWVQRNRAATSLQKSIRRFNAMNKLNGIKKYKSAIAIQSRVRCLNEWEAYQLQLIELEAEREAEAMRIEQERIAAENKRREVEKLRLERAEKRKTQALAMLQEQERLKEEQARAEREEEERFAAQQKLIEKQKLEALRQERLEEENRRRDSAVRREKEEADRREQAEADKRRREAQQRQAAVAAQSEPELRTSSGGISPHTSPTGSDGDTRKPPRKISDNRRSQQMPKYQPPLVEPEYSQEAPPIPDEWQDTSSYDRSFPPKPKTAKQAFPPKPASKITISEPQKPAQPAGYPVPRGSKGPEEAGRAGLTKSEPEGRPSGGRVHPALERRLSQRISAEDFARQQEQEAHHYNGQGGPSHHGSSYPDELIRKLEARVSFLEASLSELQEQFKQEKAKTETLRQQLAVASQSGSLNNNNHYEGPKTPRPKSQIVSAPQSPRPVQTEGAKKIQSFAEELLGPGPSPVKNLLSSWFGGAEEPEKPALFEQRPDSGIGNGKAGPSNQLAIENDKDLEMFFDIYVFCHLRGDYELTHDNAIELAALLLQIDVGDETSGALQNLKNTRELYVPADLFDYDEQLDSAILAFHRRNLKGVTQIDAKKQYINAFRNVSTWDNIIRVSVSVHEGQHAGEWFLGVTEDSLIKIELDSEGVEHEGVTWPYSTVKEWKMDTHDEKGLNLVIQAEGQRRPDMVRLVTDTETVAPLLLLLITYFHARCVGSVARRTFSKMGLRDKQPAPEKQNLQKQAALRAAEQAKEEEEAKLASLGQSCQINVYLNREAKSTNALQVHFNMSVFEVCSKLAEQVMPDQVKPFLSLKKVLVHPQDPSIVEYVMLLPTAPIGPQITPDEYFYLVTYLFIPHPVPTNPKFLQFMFYEIKESVLSGEWDLSPKEAATLAAFLLQAQTGNWNPKKTPQRLEPVIDKYIAKKYATPKITADVISIYQGHQGMPQQDALVAFIQTASCLQTYGSKEFHCIIDQKPHALRINHNKFVVYDSPTHIVYECATPSVNIQSFPEGIELHVPAANGSMLTIQGSTAEGHLIENLILGYQANM